MKHLWLLTAKDLRIEYRSRQAFLTTLFFALLILIIFQFAFDPGSPATREASPGILWVALIFPGMIRLNQSFQMETEEDSLYGIVLSPVDRGVFYLSKFLANWIFLLLVGIISTVAFLLFFGFDPSLRLFWLLLLIVLGLAGFSSLGTILAAMVAGSRSREVLLPILIFPLIIPIILASVYGSRDVLIGQDLVAIEPWLRILVVFDVVYVTIGFVVFDYVVGD